MEQQQSEPAQQKTVHHKHTQQPAAPQQNNDKFWKITTGILIVLLAFFLFKGGFTDTASPTGQAVAPTAPGEPTRVTVGVDDDPMLGDKNAPVTIIEFSDFECPFCGRFHSETFGLLKSEYIDTGKVNFVYRDFPLESLHPNARAAAKAANCAADQGKYWEMHDKLFQNIGSFSAANFKAWAQELGLDVTAWEACVNDPTADQEINGDMQDAQAAGVQGTPMFFINGLEVSGAVPFSVFKQVIDAELANN